MLNVAKLFSCNDFNNFLNSISEEDFVEKVKRPDMKWKVVQISNITFFDHLGFEMLKDAG